MLRIAHRIKAEDGVEALILAGTELPLLLRDSGDAGIEFLDTTVIHVEAIVDALLALKQDRSQQSAIQLRRPAID